MRKYKGNREVIMSRGEFNSIVSQLSRAKGYALFGKDGIYSLWLAGWLGGMLNTLKAWDK